MPTSAADVRICHHHVTGARVGVCVCVNVCLCLNVNILYVIVQDETISKLVELTRTYLKLEVSTFYSSEFKI